MSAMYVITACVLVAALWSVVCRVNAMQQGVTEPVVFRQHFVLGMGLAAALVLPAPLAKLSLALAVLCWLWMAAPRWRDGAPEGTRTDHGDLDEVPETALSRVIGREGGAASSPPGGWHADRHR